MGNNSSLPEKVLTAVQRNDVCSFQALVANFSTAGAADPVARARILEHKDKKGRTLLLVAAAKNHYQILQQLITMGADVHYINPARDSAGGALHEAAARRNEAAVELLLKAGANPFAANAAGRTALDEAVLSGHTGVVRTIETFAEFTGVVSFKTSSMAGLVSKYKGRWAVLMPYYPFGRDISIAASAPSVSSGSTAAASDARRTRRCLWLYKDKSSISPRCRLWVDGATVLTHGPAGTEGTLRLHTSHGEPMGDLATHYAQGYCVSMRPGDLTPGAAAVYHKLVALLNGPSPGNQRQQQPAVGSPLPPSPTAHGGPASFGGSANAAAVPPAAGHYSAPSGQPGAVLPPPFYPPISAAVMYGNSGGGSYVLVPPPPSPRAPAPVTSQHGGQPVAYPGAAGPCVMASPLTLYQEQQRLALAAANANVASRASQQHHPPEQSGVWPISDPTLSGPRQPQAQRPPLQPGAEGGCPCGPALGSGGEVINQVFIEQMVAVQGESDEAFASRLASAISATSGQSQQNLYPHGSTADTSAQAAASAAGPAAHTPQRQRTSGNGGNGASAAGTDPRSATPPAGASLINFQSDPGSHPGSLHGGVEGARPVDQSQLTTPHAQHRPQAAIGTLDDLDMAAVNALIAAEAAAAPATQALSGPSTSSALSPQHAPSSMKEAPSAPPADPFAPSSAWPPPQPPPPEPDADCIICLNAPKQVGFLHGDSVHRCVCRECSVHVPVGAPCPLCRQPVERVLGVY